MAVSFEFLAWDTDWFNRRIGRMIACDLCEETVQAADRWAAANNLQCLYALIDNRDPEALVYGQKNGFRWMDTQLTFELSIAYDLQDKPELEIHKPTQNEWLEVVQLASSLFTTTRFSKDLNFQRERVHALYVRWLERDRLAIPGVWVVSCSGQVAGFISGSVGDSMPGEVNIGLIGVAPLFQGQGVGAGLIKGLFVECHSNNLHHVRVVTQDKNENAKKLYYSAGFELVKECRWLHKWYY